MHDKPRETATSLNAIARRLAIGQGTDLPYLEAKDETTHIWQDWDDTAPACISEGAIVRQKGHPNINQDMLYASARHQLGQGLLGQGLYSLVRLSVALSCQTVCVVVCKHVPVHMLCSSAP